MIVDPHCSISPIVDDLPHRYSALLFTHLRCCYSHSIDYGVPVIYHYVVDYDVCYCYSTLPDAFAVVRLRYSGIHILFGIVVRFIPF